MHRTPRATNPPPASPGNKRGTMNLFSTRKHEKGTFLEANVALWPYCNLKCAYCFANPSLPPRGFDQEADARLGKLERFFLATGPWSLTISGGEPTIHPGFGDFCVRLHEGGHQVNLISNGIKKFSEVFPGRAIRTLSCVTLSCQSAHEKSDKAMAILKENIAYLQQHEVPVLVNYVLYPDRTGDPAALSEEFAEVGVRMRFKPFMGVHGDQEYPRDYTAADRERIRTDGDLDSIFITDHEHYVPTFKKCHAGSRTFYISGDTGGVHICESLQQKEIVNLYEDDAAARFLERKHDKPISCPAKRCFCWPTLEQEKFLETHDLLDLDFYDEWERISLPTEKALAHWESSSKAFVQELDTHLKGSDVFLWGGGIHTIALLDMLLKHGYGLERFAGIIDINPLQHGKAIQGLPIISKEEFTARHAATCSDILISSRFYEKEIKGQIALEVPTPANVVCLYDGSMEHELDTV